MDYSYDSYDSLFGGLAAISIILIVLVIAFAVVCIIASWKLYKKAGKGGWECIVPVYSYWVLTEIAGLNWWWFLLAMADSIVSLIGLEDLETITNLVSLFATFNIYYNIAKKFGKTNGTSVCAGIFSGIFVLIFGFSKNEVYNANIPVSKNGIFGTPEENGSSNTYNQNTTMNASTTMVDNSIYNQNMEVKSTETVDSNNNFGQINASASTGTVDTSSTVINNVNQPVQEYSFCGNCGTKLSKDARFCPNCGKENNN